MSKSIKEIQEIFENADMSEYDSIQESLKDDERAGVIKLIMKYNKKKKAFEDEVQRIFDMKEFESGSFNTILDKGTLDCILCGDNSVPNAAKMMSEMFRLLAPGGHYMVITYGDPDVRKKYLETQQWASLSVDKLAKPSAAVSSTINADENDVKNFHYVYTMEKPK